MSAIVVQRAVPARGLPAARSLHAYARAALPQRHGELTIRIVGPQESRRLNRDFRRKDQPTNVLSFLGQDAILGDLVICAAVVAREAREQRKPPQAHWAHMVVHGCLHLQGLNHEHELEAARMEAREIRILKNLGFPDPYR